MFEEQLSTADVPVEGQDDLGNEATSSVTAATDSGEAPAAEPQETTYDIGGKTYSESEMSALMDDATNARKFIADATQRSQQANTTLTEAQKIMDDPRYKQAVEVMDLLEDPAIEARFKAVYGQATGLQPMNAPGYDPAVPMLKHEIAELKQAMGVVYDQRSESEAERCASEFAQWAKDEYGKELTPDEIETWVENEYVPNTNDSVRGYDDNLEYMKFHWSRTNGRQTREAMIAKAREDARREMGNAADEKAEAASGIQPGAHEEDAFTGIVGDTSFRKTRARAERMDTSTYDEE